MAGTPTGRGRQREREGVPMTFIHRTHARPVRKWWTRRADGTMSHVVWAHFPEMQGNKELHFEIEVPVDLKNFKSVLHDNVKAVDGLRFVRVRNHAEREPAHVACISGGRMGHGSSHEIEMWSPYTTCTVVHSPRTVNIVPQRP